jgi:hypothetical protein
MAVATDRVGPTLHHQLGLVDPSLDGKLFDDDVPTAGQFPRVERCRAVHWTGATGAFIMTICDVPNDREAGL